MEPKLVLSSLEEARQAKPDSEDRPSDLGRASDAVDARQSAVDCSGQHLAQSCVEAASEAIWPDAEPSVGLLELQEEADVARRCLVDKHIDCRLRAQEEEALKW